MRLLSAIFCEEIDTTDDQMNFYGVFRVLEFPSLPTSYTFFMAFEVFFTAKEVSESAGFLLEIVSPEKETLHVEEFELPLLPDELLEKDTDLTKLKSHSGYGLELRNLKLTSEGVYQVNFIRKENDDEKKIVANTMFRVLVVSNDGNEQSAGDQIPNETHNNNK